MDVTSFMYTHIHPVLRLNRDLERFGVFVALTDATGLRMMQRRYQEQPAAEGHQMVVMPLPDVDFPARVALFYRNLPTLLEPLRVVVLRADDVDIIFADIEAALFALHRRRDLERFGVFVALTDATGLRMMQRRYQEQPAAEGHQMVVMPLPDVDFPARVALFCRNLPTLLEPLRVVVLRADDVDIIFADIEAALFALYRRRPVFMVGYWARRRRQGPAQPRGRQHQRLGPAATRFFVLDIDYAAVRASSTSRPATSASGSRGDTFFVLDIDYAAPRLRARDISKAVDDFVMLSALPSPVQVITPVTTSQRPSTTSLCYLPCPAQPRPGDHSGHCARPEAHRSCPVAVGSEFTIRADEVSDVGFMDSFCVDSVVDSVVDSKPLQLDKDVATKTFKFRAPPRPASGRRGVRRRDLDDIVDVKGVPFSFYAPEPRGRDRDLLAVSLSLSLSPSLSPPGPWFHLPACGTDDVNGSRMRRGAVVPRLPPWNSRPLKSTWWRGAAFTEALTASYCNNSRSKRAAVAIIVRNGRPASVAA
ncbi:hypothetical protein B0T24DRAFT_725231 [Lasiosphaeria ovina]|uniref:Uncharacterized protein n=1 Tax=Lasiosphaeria ovina TaxID=92902 RepID=A0AAE0JS25_9PEZI|nr:hypothetical protein B0T24DRAFT_725231 [Lasiosphaeria ovina]